MDIQNNMNQPQPSAPMPAPAKKGNGTLITVIILIVLAVLAIMLFGKKRDAGEEMVPAAGIQEEGDLSSIEADIEATEFDGVSEGL